MLILRTLGGSAVVCGGLDKRQWKQRNSGIRPLCSSTPMQSTNSVVLVLCRTVVCCTLYPLSSLSSLSSLSIFCGSYSFAIFFNGAYTYRGGG